MRGRWIVPVVIAAGLGLTGAGHAQTLPEADPYAPLGLRTGGLTLFSSLETLGVVSSNINQVNTGEEAGVGATLRPSLSFKSDWVRHSWTGEASIDMLRYLDHSELATTSAGAATNFRLDVRRTTRAEFSASYELDADAEFDTGVLGSEIGGATEHLASAGTAIVHDFGPLEGSLRGSVARGLFEDVKLSGGGSQDNGDQDYWEPSLSARATYTDPPMFKPFIEAGYQRRLHDLRLDRNGQHRDSHGLSLRAGVVLDDGPMWSGELAATYLRRDFDDDALVSNDAVGFDGAVTWSPAELTALTFSFGTELSDSTEAGDEGGQSWTVGVELSQGLRDNLDLLASTGLTIDNEVAGTDLTYDASVGLTWKLNRNVALTTVYDFTLLDASVAADGYTEHRVSAGMVLRH